MLNKVWSMELNMRVKVHAWPRTQMEKKSTWLKVHLLASFSAFNSSSVFFSGRRPSHEFNFCFFLPPGRPVLPSPCTRSASAPPPLFDVPGWWCHWPAAAAWYTVMSSTPDPTVNNQTGPPEDPDGEVKGHNYGEIKPVVEVEILYCSKSGNTTV